MKYEEYKEHVMKVVQSPVLVWAYQVRDFDLMNDKIYKCLGNISSISKDIQSLEYWYTNTESTISESTDGSLSLMSSRLEHKPNSVSLSYKGNRVRGRLNQNLIIRDSSVSKFLEFAIRKLNNQLENNIRKLIDLKWDPRVLFNIYNKDGTLLYDIRLLFRMKNMITAITRSDLKVFIETRIREITNELEPITEVT